jgi:hypothetical protein
MFVDETELDRLGLGIARADLERAREIQDQGEFAAV